MPVSPFLLCSRRRLITPVLFVLAGLAACQYAPVTDESSPYFRIPPGTTLTLHRRLVVPAGKWSVYFQAGRVTSFGGVDEYRAYCELDATGPKEQPQYIEPGDFEVVNVRDDLNSVQAGPVRLAASTVRVGGLLDRQFVRYETVLQLHVPDQPRATQLRCARLDEAGLGYYPSLAEIRAALGDVITVRLPDAGRRPGGA